MTGSPEDELPNFDDEEMEPGEAEDAPMREDAEGDAVAVKTEQLDDAASALGVVDVSAASEISEDVVFIDRLAACGATLCPPELTKDDIEVEAAYGVVVDRYTASSQASQEDMKGITDFLSRLPKMETVKLEGGADEVGEGPPVAPPLSLTPDKYLPSPPWESGPVATQHPTTEELRLMEDERWVLMDTVVTVAHYYRPRGPSRRYPPVEKAALYLRQAEQAALKFCRRLQLLASRYADHGWVVHCRQIAQGILSQKDLTADVFGFFVVPYREALIGGLSWASGVFHRARCPIPHALGNASGCTPTTWRDPLSVSC